MKENKRLERNFKAWLRWNCSTLFLLKPIVGHGIGDLHPLGLINSYLYDEGKDGDLFVLFHPKDGSALEVFIALQMSQNKLFIGDYDYEGGYIVCSYNIPDIYKNDFLLFKQGKYSKMSPFLKQQHETKVVIGGKQEQSFQYMVFYKDPKLKQDIEEYFETSLSNEDELWQVPTHEILLIEDIKIKENECITNSPTEIGGATTNKRFLSYRNSPDGGC